MRFSWGVGDGLCKLSIWRCVHLSYLPCLECTRLGLDKHSALMSFIPLFIPYLFTCVTLRVSFDLLVLSPTLLSLDVFHRTASLPLFFPPPLSPALSLFYHLISCSLWHFLPLPVHLSSSDSLSVTLLLSFSTRVICGIYLQTWSRALLSSALLCVETLIRGIAWQCSPQACIFKINRCSFTHKHTQTPFKFTEVL